MKILLASDTWSPMVNGVVRSVELLYHQLLALGHDVRVVTLAQNGHSHEENGILYVGSISAERVYPGVRISAAGALPISHWLDELEAWGPEVIHTQSEFSTFMLAQRVARRCHCPVVHTYHTVYEDYTQYLFFSERLGRMHPHPLGLLLPHAGPHRKGARHAQSLRGQLPGGHSAHRH